MKDCMRHQFVKKTDKTPPKELALAHTRMTQWKDADTQEKFDFGFQQPHAARC